MSKTINLGGDRLGSGAKNNISIHNYKRSTHDLSRAFRSTMNCGTLVPFIKEIALPGDTFSIDLETRIRTIPTIAPMFGSYKLQLDIFECPIRLYNGLLHNNMTKIGMNMSQVKLPKYIITTRVNNPTKITENPEQIANSSLLKYLGLSGIADVKFDKNTTYVDLERKINAVPYLAYWDIYKNYYANKQEEKGVMIHQTVTTTDSSFTNFKYYYTQTNGNHWQQIERLIYFNGHQDPRDADVTLTTDSYQGLETPMYLTGERFYKLNFDGPITNGTVTVVLYDEISQTYHIDTLENVFSSYEVEGNTINLGYINPSYENTSTERWYIVGIGYDKVSTIEKNYTKLKIFDLSNIDQARINILQNTGLNNQFIINTDLNITPYIEPLQTDAAEHKSYSRFEQEGLGIKTYQSDLFNNWLETEWIDGTNGINQITAIDVSGGSFTIDALNLANKVYNMLNRVAVSGGSYEDWQEAVYTSEVNRRAETPVYKGGMAAEIMFDEVISTTPTEDKPLGTLAGKGGEYQQRGGHIEINVAEPSYIIGIVSITPRIDYSQGNDWDLTELDTMDDLHKPALDGIGFEDLLQERMAWFGTYYDETNNQYVQLAAGKVPAWINYMTSFNKCYGGFADKDKNMFMTLNRQYEMTQGTPSAAKLTYGINDLTTYVDPSKYNYCFADASIDAQNFWVQIGMKVEARRVMSAKIIPNL